LLRQLDRGHLLRDQRVFWTPERKAQALALRHEGKSLADITWEFSGYWMGEGAVAPTQVAIGSLKNDVQRRA
jgi:hypothetical protein